MKKLIIVFILSLIFCDNQIIKSVELDSLGKDTLSQYFCKDGQLFKYIKYNYNQPEWVFNFINLDCITDISNIPTIIWYDNVHGDFTHYFTDLPYQDKINKSRDISSKIYRKGQYKYGKQSGKWTYYYRNRLNTIKSEGYYCKDNNWEEDGTWIFYNEDETLQKEVYYKCGLRDSQILEIRYYNEDEDFDKIISGISEKYVRGELEVDFYQNKYLKVLHKKIVYENRNIIRKEIYEDGVLIEIKKY